MSHTCATPLTPAAAYRLRDCAKVSTTAVLALLLTIGLTGCPGGSKIAGDALGNLLSGMREQVDAAITNASNQGQILVITAGGQVDLALSNAESAFAEDLNTSIHDVDAATQANIDRLQVLVNDLGSQSQAVIASAIDGSQQLVNSLPFTNKNPQVRTYSPEYLGRRGSNVQIQVSGNFFYASEQKKAVTLTVGGQTFNPDLNTTTTVGFSVPASSFPQASDSPTPVTLTLTAPYEKGSLFKKSIVPGTFHLLVTSLPANPIKSLTLTNTTTVHGTETTSKTAPGEYATSGTGWRVESWNSCKDQNDSHDVSPDPGGWQIVTSSITVNYIARGYAPRGEAEVTRRSRPGSTCRGTRRRTATARSAISPATSSTTCPIPRRGTPPRPATRQSTWKPRIPGSPGGDTLSQPVTPHAWTVKAVLWDGRTLETSGSNNSNPYIQVADKTDHVEVSLTTPGSLSGL